MEIDLQTLKELELFSFDSMGTCIFDLVNECTTPGGKYKLKQNFKRPYKSLGEIIQVQDALKYLLSIPHVWELPVDTKLMDLLDVYYFSKSNPSLGKNIFARFIESISYRFLYKDFKLTFIDGTRYVIHFLKLISSFILEIDKSKLPPALRDIFVQIEDILGLKLINEALVQQSIKGISSIQLLKFDKAFRETHKDEILKLIDLVYELDVLLSKANATQKLNLNFPEFADSKKVSFEIEGLYHLFVTNPIVNDIKTTEDENFIFLTGPNMAGKTTFLKSCGLAVFLAHLGMGVPAKRMKLSLFDRLFTSLNVSDNLPKGYSYFYSEVKRVKEAALALRESEKVFVVFDELFKGTNVKDAFDGSLLIIKELVKWKSSFFILSSHLLELGKEINSLPGIRFMCFDSKVENGKPYFNFKIKEGLSDERLGLIILKSEQVFDLLNPEIQNINLHYS
jgi:DNA mismatch repair protein MutS